MIDDFTDEQYYKLWKLIEDKVATFEATGKGITYPQYKEMKLLLNRRKKRR